MMLRIKNCATLVLIYSFGILFLYYTYTNTSERVTKYIKTTILNSDMAMNARQKVEYVIQLLERDIKRKEHILEPKLILMYTPLFGNYPWPESAVGNIQRCSLTNCNITYNRSHFLESDLVVFHGRDLPGVDHMVQLHTQRPLKQRWVFFIWESPINTPSLSPYDGMFNWTVTYRRESDVFWPYNFYSPLKYSKDIRDINFAKNKTKMVAIMNSHCVPYRTKIVKALLDLNIPVDVYGGCSERQERVCGWSCPNFFKDYKFYLAFENSYCPDYITEKYWNALNHSMIPIVIGGANYSNSNLAIPNSFINALDFDSIKDLADYVRYLDSNDTAYNEYFAWRQNYYVGFLNGNTPCCKWCEMLSDPKTPRTKVYHQISEFWGRSLCKDIDAVVHVMLFLV